MKVGDLTVQRDLLDVRDVVAAYLALLDPAVPAGTYNVARGEAVPLADVLALLVGAASAPISVARDPARMRAGRYAAALRRRDQAARGDRLESRATSCPRRSPTCWRRHGAP